MTGDIVITVLCLSGAFLAFAALVLPKDER